MADTKASPETERKVRVSHKLLTFELDICAFSNYNSSSIGYAGRESFQALGQFALHSLEGFHSNLVLPLMRTIDLDEHSSSVSPLHHLLQLIEAYLDIRKPQNVDHARVWPSKLVGNSVVEGAHIFALVILSILNISESHVGAPIGNNCSELQYSYIWWTGCLITLAIP